MRAQVRPFLACGPSLKRLAAIPLEFCLKISGFVLSLILGLSLINNVSAEGTAVEPSYQSQADQAQHLLAQAIERYRQIGDQALAEFSRQGAFVQGEQYVYVVDTHGVMLASGGPSALYIGRNITALIDPSLGAAFTNALNQPESQAIHSQEYHWMNWHDGKVERKRAFFQRVDDKVFAVGYYLPRSSPSAAQALLDDALKDMKNEPHDTIARINQLDPKLTRDDLYVFVIDTDNMKMVAHGYNRRLIGTDFRQLMSVDGQPVGQQMLTAIEGRDKALTHYLWRNPVTQKPEPKETLLERSGHYIVAVGYYANPDENAKR
ncbi:cache domain-containing protein [Pseudomonas sp. SbOxS1]|uniref:cache domain-containing protein n=1 Tax=Pseudomonas sp. SbOxS1 TaxID=2723884 RepID=UPI0034D25C8D